jgi:hypothetical protein
MNEIEVIKELDEQIHSYIDICAMYEKTPSVLGFADFLVEAYEEAR